MCGIFGFSTDLCEVESLELMRGALQHRGRDDWGFYNDGSVALGNVLLATVDIGHGKQPYLRPGENFQYTSGTMLETPVGTMHGSYEMVSDDGEHFDADIAPFSLSMPRTLH